MTRTISILGATGSIGASTLDLVRREADRWRVVALTANGNVAELARLAREFSAEVAVTADEACLPELREALGGSGIAAAGGAAALVEAAQRPADITIAAIVGCAGLAPTMAAIGQGGTIGLANKEALVSAGEVMTSAVARHGATLLPVDSEHNAIFQCLAGNDMRHVRSITLTASGGPFRDWTAQQLCAATPQQAVKHPNWDMGAKITIDSASLMNKGLEAIEAKWLFNLKPEQVEIIVHAQSIIHSMVQFRDGSMKAQMGLPDMKLPIQYALAYPHRLSTTWPRFDFANFPSFSFEQPDHNAFPNLGLALDAMKRGGNAPCVLNAANEVAVEAFLDERIGFREMSDLIADRLAKSTFVSSPTLEELEASDADTRRMAYETLNTPQWRS